MIRFRKNFEEKNQAQGENILSLVISFLSTFCYSSLMVILNVTRDWVIRAFPFHGLISHLETPATEKPNFSRFLTAKVVIFFPPLLVLNFPPCLLPLISDSYQLCSQQTQFSRLPSTKASQHSRCQSLRPYLSQGSSTPTVY